MSGKREDGIPRWWRLTCMAHSGTSRKGPCFKASRVQGDLTGFYQPSNNELDFGGCQAFLRVRFLHCAFIKKKRKIMHGFRNTQSSFSAFSFPLYFKKIKRAKENLGLLNVHSYHPLEKSGVQNRSRNWSSLSWILGEFKEKAMYHLYLYNDESVYHCIEAICVL